MNKRNNNQDPEDQPAGQLRKIMDDIFAEFTDLAGLVNDRRCYRLMEKHLTSAATLCKEKNIAPAFYVRAILAYQPPQGDNYTYMPWQVYPLAAHRFVQDYLQTYGVRDLQKEFESQCRILGTALQNGIADYLILQNPSADFAAWFRVLMTSEPNKAIIDKYGKEAKSRLDLDYELKRYLISLEVSGNKLDLNRIPGFNYE